MMRIYRARREGQPRRRLPPIFLQMPFFIALYWVLLSTVEMRQAPWIGWITDLSVRDPLLHPAADHAGGHVPGPP